MTVGLTADARKCSGLREWPLRVGASQHVEEVANVGNGPFMWVGARKLGWIAAMRLTAAKSHLYQIAAMR